MSFRPTRSSPIFLVGFMAAGKTSVGRALAERLGWELADTDRLVEEASGMPIEAIFRSAGEGAFRDTEWSVLNELAGRSRLVVATGGGLFLGVPHRAFLRREGVSCWLDASLDAVAARVGRVASRPLWPSGDALDRRAFFERRRAVYALADLVVDATHGDAADVARRVEDRWSRFFL